MNSRQRWIVAAALVTQAFAVGLTHGIYPVFLEPLEAAFDAPRTLVAGGQVLMMLSLTASSLATGLLFDQDLESVKQRALGRVAHDRALPLGALARVTARAVLG